ncbi:hypothetical protein LCGC14_1904340, partial [marine sediment metagenome]
MRSTRAGDLHIKKDIFHWGALSIAQTIGDNELQEMIEVLDFPEFGNRILVRSVLPSSGQGVKVTMSIENSCIRGDGIARTKATAVVTDIKGSPVPDNTTVKWSVNDTSLFSIVPQSLTGEKFVSGEEKRAISLSTVSVKFPIVSIMGVFIKMDTRRQTNFFTGGSFLGRTITLGTILPFSNSEVIIDYVAGGVTETTIQSISGTTEGDSTFINAAVGNVRDSRSLCVRNSRNIVLSIVSDPSEHNLCLDGAHNSTIIAHVRDNGDEGQGIGINWGEDGPGEIDKTFTLVKNQTIEFEFVISQNFFTVNTKYKIVSVVGVWLAEEGKASTNLFSTSMHRTGSFNEREIILGTDLPDQRERVIIEYKARSIAIIQYTGPTTGTGPAISTITAKIDDGTQLGIEEELDITFVYRCPDEDGEIPGVDPATGLPTGQGLGGSRIKEPDCGDSSAAADSCDSEEGLEAQTECICGALTGEDGCPATEDGCREMCQEDYNENGFSSLHCEVETADDFCKRETGRSSGGVFEQCQINHEEATVDKCTERCVDHSVETGELSISGEGNICDDGEVTYTAVGGAGPYTWGASGGEGDPGLALSGDNNKKVTVTPPDKEVVAGTAYRLGLKVTNPASCPDGAFDCGNTVGCDGVEISGCTGPLGPAAEGNNWQVVCTTGGACESFLDCAPCGTACSGFAIGNPLDKRTQQMIDDGCLPCALSMDGVTITVTDAEGVSVVTVIS